MKTWQGAWFLAKEELRRTRWKHLITIVFIGYLILFIVPMFSDALKGEDDIRIVFWSVDFITVSLLPCLGLMSNQQGYYWKTDTNTKKLASWRVMPIPIRQIVWGRLLLLLSNAIPALILFFIAFYFIGHANNPSIEPYAFIPFAIFWAGYAVAGSVIFIYFETGVSGIKYFWFCTAVTVGLLAAMVVTTLLLKTSFVLSSYRFIEDGGWWLALIGVALAIAAFAAMPPLMEKKVRTRSFTS
ncbi:hypothetical protein D3P08_18605 [Paenibacillus nanensis]|uniref:ABC-2 transporter permease n=1 Tax=Paenibacillus nanensis TaxID=393251 RepID=A0A3A1UQA6_9BACL|nr:hypothetical protein [Paenibacillus nanensis]RIX50719.1 hypothetical protein D3P08_18605 [Paenibacillus nanensis]